MKILLVAPQPYYEERGTPIAVRQLARTLASLGHTVDLLAYPFGDDPGDGGVVVHRCVRIPGIRKMPIGFSLAKILTDIPLSWSMLRMHLKHHYDVIHAGEEAVYPALLVAGLRHARVVYDMDSSLADQLAGSGKGLRGRLRPIFDWLERIAIKRSDRVAAVCDELVDIAAKAKPRDEIAALYDVPNLESPATAAASVDSEDLRAGLPGNRLVALYVGNLERYQGIDLLLESIPSLKPIAELSVVVVGGLPEHISHYEDKARTLGIAETVRFVGPRPLEQLGQLLSQADILLSPRITGGNTPMKIYSYMAASKPVLATRLSTHTQVLDDDTAMLAEPEPGAYGRALAELISDPALRERLSGNAARLVHDKYSQETYQATVRKLYEGLV